MAKINLTVEEREELLQRVWQDYEWGKAENDRRSADWSDWRDQFESEWVALKKVEQDEELDQWFYVPMTRTQIHRLECTLLNHFLPDQGVSRLGKFTPIMGADPQAVEWLDEAVHVKVDLELNAWNAWHDAFESALVEEVGVIKAWWEDDGKRSRARQVYVPSENVYWDPYALDDDDIRWFIHIKWVFEDELWELQQQGHYENIEDVVQGGDEAHEDEWRRNVASGGNKARWMYKLMEFWGPVQVTAQEALDKQHEKGKHTVSRDVVATVYQNRVVLRVEENPYATYFTHPTPYEKLPFFLVKADRRRAETYGQSMVDLLTDPQREMNLLHNQRRQAVDLEMTGKLLYDATRLLDVQALERARYGGAVPVQGRPSDVATWFTASTSTQVMVQEKQMMEAAIRDLTGVTNIHMGAGEPGVDTATGMSLITAEGNVIQDTMIATVAQTGVLPVLRFFAECVKRHVLADELWKIIGTETRPPNLSEVIGEDYLIEVASGASPTARQIEVRDLQSTMAMLAQMANAMPDETRMAMVMLMPRLLRLQHAPEAAKVFAKLAEQMAARPLQGSQAPAAQGVPGTGNLENQRAMAMQGRRPTPAEQPGLGPPLMGG